MPDIREDILARMLVVLATVPGLQTVHRNETELVTKQLPAGNVLDGDEEVVAGNDGSRPSNRPLLVEMTPTIVIAQQADQIGPALTTFRREVIKLMLADATLVALTGSNGAIRYGGCDTSFGWQEKWFGFLNIRFTFKYPLKPDEL